MPETEVIRVKEKTKRRLEKRARYGDTMDDVIQSLLIIADRPPLPRSKP